MFLNLVVNLSLECPTVLDLAGGEKEFNNRGIGYFFFFFFFLVLSPLGSSVHEKKDEEHDHQSVLVKMCGKKVVKFIQDGIVIFTIIQLIYARSSLESSRFLW